MGEGRVPSTKGSHTVDQRGAGTGQHVNASVDVGEGLTFGDRAVISPTKRTGPQPAFSNTRRGEASGIDIQPPTAERNASMMQDTGPKTSREREFNAEMTRRREALTSPNSDRQFYPDALEDQKNEFSKGDGYSATKAAFRAKKAQ